MRAIDIDPDSWEEVASDRPKWRATVQHHLKLGESSIHAAAAEKRARRTTSQRPEKPEIHRCDRCGRACLSRIGLHSHQRRCARAQQNIWTMVVPTEGANDDDGNPLVMQYNHILVVSLYIAILIIGLTMTSFHCGVVSPSRGTLHNGSRTTVEPLGVSMGGCMKHWKSNISWEWNLIKRELRLEYPLAIIKIAIEFIKTGIAIWNQILGMYFLKKINRC